MVSGFYSGVVGICPPAVFWSHDRQRYTDRVWWIWWGGVGLVSHEERETNPPKKGAFLSPKAKILESSIQIVHRKGETPY